MRSVSRSLVALLIAAAAASAALAHGVIDVIADYLVAHASFDDVASHGSRGIVVAIAVVASVVLGARALRLCCDVAANRATRVAEPPTWWSALPFVLLAAVLACCAVPAMELLDARFAGEALDGLTDAFGGSVLLGIATTALCASLVSFALFAFVRWLLSHRAVIVAAIASILRRVDGFAQRAWRLTRRTRVLFYRPQLAASRRGNRAPPRLLLASVH